MGGNAIISSSGSGAPWVRYFPYSVYGEDTTADCSAAVTAAITELMNTYGGGEISFGPCPIVSGSLKSFRMTNVELPLSITLSGVDRYLTQIRQKAGATTPVFKRTAIVPPGSWFVSGYAKGTIQRIYINASSGTSQATYCFDSQLMAYCNISHCLFAGASQYNLRLQGHILSSFRDVLVRGGANGILLEGSTTTVSPEGISIPANAISMDTMTFSSLTGRAVHYKNAAGLWMRNIDVEVCGAAGVAAIDLESPKWAQGEVTGVTIDNVWCEYASGDAFIRLTGGVAYKAILRNISMVNVATKPTYGIYIEGGSASATPRYTIENCTMQSGAVTSAGLYVSNQYAIGSRRDSSLYNITLNSSTCDDRGGNY